jgi:dipeptidyl aminopeptidase/acylaminoacyl peptidase
VSDKRLLLIILICLVIGAACVNQKPTSLGYIYFSRDSVIWKLDLSNGQETLLLDRQLTERVDASPDGRTLSYIVLEEIRRGGAKSVWIVNTHTGQETRASHSMPFLSQFWLPDSRLLVIEYPDWHISPNGTSLVKEGSARSLIIETTTGQSTPAPWSVATPDNGNVLYAPTFDCAAKTILSDHAQDILQVVCLGSSEPITVATPLSLGNVAWSLDGNLLAFYAGEETTTWDSWQLYFWQRETQVLRGIDLGDRTALGLSFSPDSRWLAFEDDSNLCVVNLDDNDSVTCFENYMSVVGAPVSWSFDSHNVVLVTCADGVCSEIGCDCSNNALVTIAIPSGEITELTRGVDTVPFPVWGR